MRDLREGMFARSLAGHDKGKLYVVTGTDGPYVFLADGKNRKAADPKRKKRIHVQPDFHMAEKLRAAEDGFSDEEIVRALRDREKNPQF